jgi:hypothetical protein
VKKHTSNYLTLLNPHEVVIGPDSISGQFILPGADRKRSTPRADELGLRLRVVSHVIADLVTPFQAAMLEVRCQGFGAISSRRAFSYPVPAGRIRDEGIVFIIPADLSLDRAVLRIHYYSDAKEIPLHLPRVD